MMPLPPVPSPASARRPVRRSAGAAMLAALVATAACTPQTEQARPHAERLASLRAAKDRFLLTAPDSPILPADRDRFLPLAYFDVDPAFAVPAQMVPSGREPALEMATSTGQRRLMRRAGTLRFSLRGQVHTLTAFVEADAPDLRRLFVPFGDLTNGTETYAGGRYLDLERTATGLYEIDFNLAYHPYCYYNPAYDCPYPPAENRLPVPIRAGERMRP